MDFFLDPISVAFDPRVLLPIAVSGLLILTVLAVILRREVARIDPNDVLRDP